MCFSILLNVRLVKSRTSYLTLGEIIAMQLVIWISTKPPVLECGEHKASAATPSGAHFNEDLHL